MNPNEKQQQEQTSNAILVAICIIIATIVSLILCYPFIKAFFHL